MTHSQLPASREQAEATLWRRVQEHLAYAAAHAPYYRETWSTAGLDLASLRLPEDLRHVPTIDKEAILELVQAAPPSGRLLAVHPDRLVRLYLTPGPILIPYTARDYANVAAGVAKAFWRMGARPEDIVDNTFNFHFVTAGSLYDEAFRQIGCATIPGGPGQSKQHIEVMQLARASLLLAFPTFVEHLLETADEMGVDPQRQLAVRKVFVAGEVHSDAVKRRIAERFAATVREHYATGEIGMVAYECEYGGGMHLVEDVWAEVVDPETGRPVPPGEQGELILTEVEREAWPIIRLRTHDITAGLSFAPCPCGNPMPRLGRILGRVGGIPRVKGLFVSPKEVQRALDCFPGSGRYQLVIGRERTQDQLTVRLEYAGTEPHGELAPKLVRELKDRIRLTATVELLAVGALGEEPPQIVDHRRV